MNQLRGLVHRVSLGDLRALEQRVFPHDVSTCFVPVTLQDAHGASAAVDVLHPGALLRLVSELPAPDALARVEEATDHLDATAPLTPRPTLWVRCAVSAAAAELSRRHRRLLAHAAGRLMARRPPLVESLVDSLRHGRREEAARYRGAVEALASAQPAAALALAAPLDFPPLGRRAAAALAQRVRLDRPAAGAAFLEAFAARDEAAAAPESCATQLAIRLRRALERPAADADALREGLRTACRFNIDPGAVFPTDAAAIWRWAEPLLSHCTNPSERAAAALELVRRRRLEPRRVTVESLSHGCLSHLERAWLKGQLGPIESTPHTPHTPNTPTSTAEQSQDETARRRAHAWVLRDVKRTLVDNRMLSHYADLLARGEVEVTDASFPHFLEECGECHGDGEMPEVLRFVMPRPTSGLTLAEALVGLAPHCAFWRTLIQHFPDSVCASTSAWRDGVCVAVRLPRCHECVAAAQRSRPAPPLPVIFEDDDILVLSKPPCLATSRHALSGTQLGDPHATDVVSLAMANPKWSAALSRAPRFGQVHRLDTETSGCLVMAKTAAAADGLRHQFATAAAHGEGGKVYTALCVALEPDLSRIPRAGRLTDPMERRIATTYRVCRVFPRARVALVECRIAQGKKHQVRRHLAAAGLPVVQDVEHGGAACASPVMGRVALHAAAITIVHPTTAEGMTLVAPMPEDFQEAMRQLC